MNKLRFSSLLLSATLILSACGSSTQPTASSASNTVDGDIVGENGVRLSEIGSYGLPTRATNSLLIPGAVAGDPQRLTQQRLPTGPVRILSAPGGRLSAQNLTAQSLPSNAQTSKVALKVLVLYAGTGDYGLAPAKALLSQHGIVYDTLDATAQPLSMTDLVRSDGVGKYAGVILASSSLTTESSPGVYTSALSDVEWASLFEYESSFKVRQLALFGYPGVAPEDYGLRAVTGAETSSADATVTASGKAIFSDLTSVPVPVRYSYAYPSQVQAVTGVSTTPLLTDASGNVLAVSSTSPDGRERILLTMAQNEYLLHTQLLGNGLVNWLMKGVYLGEYHRYLGVDIDDWFATGDRYDAPTRSVVPNDFRLKASDALATRDQQQAIRRDYSVAKNFGYSIAYNGQGADILAPRTCTPSSSVKDPLSAVSKCLGTEFDWVNHTFSHLLMDNASYADASKEIGVNTLVGLFMGLHLSSKSLVTGENSGLGYKAADGGENEPKQDYGLLASNPNMLNAASNLGVRYIASNHSVPSQVDAACPSCGIVHPLKSTELLIPRWPVNVFYYATTPDEAVISYNAVYAPGGTAPFWDHPLSFTEYLDKESDLGLQHILTGNAWPHYMHQTNLNQYASGKSLATDWVRAVLDKYSRYSSLPLNTLRWDDLGAYVDRHTKEVKAESAGQLSAVWDRSTNNVAVTSTAGNLPVSLTGASSGTLYGSLKILNRTVSGTVTLPVAPR